MSDDWFQKVMTEKVDEYDYLMHYADKFEMDKIEDFWARACGDKEPE